MTRPVTPTTLPLTVATPATQAAPACDITKSAVIVVPPKKKLAITKLTLATEASAEASAPPPMTAECEAPTVSPLTTLVSSAAVSWKLVEALVLLLPPKPPPNIMICACGSLAGKQHNSPVNRAAATGCGNL